MSASKLAETLAQHNITPEDLEKAASVRIVQKVASAEGIDLDQLSGAQLEELFAHFEQNVLSGLLGGEAQAAGVEEKIASLTQEQAFELFDKQASAEGLDLSGASDEQLGAAFEYFVEHVLPVMAANDFEPVVPSAEKQAEVAEAQAKLAEADILGRQMARGYMDEMGKIATDAVPPSRQIGAAAPTLRERASAGARSAASAVHGGAGRLGEFVSRGHLTGGKAKALGYGLGAAAIGGTALGAKKLLGGKKPEEKESTASVTLTAEDVTILNQLAYSGDVEGLQKAASLIKSAAIAVTDAGHEYEKSRGAAESAGHGRMARAAREYTSEQPLLGHLQGMPLQALGHQLAARHGEYKERKHGDKRQSLNPFGGWLTKTKAEEADKKADAMIDTLVEDRAAELASAWLVENGYAE